MTEAEQPAFDARFDWSAEGAVLLARGCPVVVVVDVLRFTTAVEIAVARGAVVVPRPWVEDRGSPTGADPGATPPPPTLPAPGPTPSPPRRCSGSPQDPGRAGVAQRSHGEPGRRRGRAAVAAFRDAAGDLPGLLAGCVSGRELAARGHAADLALAAGHDVSTAVPGLTGGAFAQLSWPG